MEFVKQKIRLSFIEDCICADKKFINEIYTLDKDKTCESCSLDLFNKMADDEIMANNIFYRIVDDEKTIGFMATNTINGNNILRTFYIKPIHRDKKDLFIQKMFEMFDEWVTVIFNTNYPAIGFFNRNKGKVINVMKDDLGNIALLFKFKKQ